MHGGIMEKMHLTTTGRMAEAMEKQQLLNDAERGAAARQADHVTAQTAVQAGALQNIAGGGKTKKLTKRKLSNKKKRKLSNKKKRRTTKR